MFLIVTSVFRWKFTSLLYSFVICVYFYNWLWLLCLIDSVDVNLTPDKRKILVQEEKTLLAIIKVSLCSRNERDSFKMKFKL